MRTGGDLAGPEQRPATCSGRQAAGGRSRTPAKPPPSTRTRSARGTGTWSVLRDATHTPEGCTPKCHPERDVKGEAGTPMAADVRDGGTSRTGSAAGARPARTRSCGWNSPGGCVSAVGSYFSPARLPQPPVPALLRHGDQEGTRLACVGRQPQGEGPAAGPRAAALPLPQQPAHGACREGPPLPRAVRESGNFGASLSGPEFRVHCSFSKLSGDR